MAAAAQEAELEERAAAADWAAALRAAAAL